MRFPIGMCAILLNVALTTSQANGGTPVCSVINAAAIPSDYLAGTQKCSLGQSVGATTSTCADDNGTEATFATAVTEFNAGVSNGGWATWSLPPFSEDPFPWVGFTNGTSNTIRLTRNAGVLGIEVEPEHFGLSNVTAIFRDGSGNVLTTRRQKVDGGGGSRLFAAICNKPVIRSVTILTDEASRGFAVGQIRSDKMVGVFAPTRQAPISPAVVPPGTTTNRDLY
jgi:hypothetical protein